MSKKKWTKKIKRKQMTAHKKQLNIRVVDFNCFELILMVSSENLDSISTRKKILCDQHRMCFYGASPTPIAIGFFL